MSTELIIYAVIAGILIFWLKNTLGTRTGEERERVNPLTQLKQTPPADAVKPNDKAQDVGFTLSVIKNDKVDKKTDDQDDWSNLPIDSKALLGLHLIAAADKSFKVKKFLDGARDVFPMIIESFARGDKDQLARFLTPSLYKNFATEIAARASRGEQLVTDIHAVREAKLLNAELRGTMAFVTVRFKAEETSVIRNDAGEIIRGNPNRTSDLIDIWVFGRDVKSADPTWFLYETRDDVAQ